ncbi:hypothetical protein ACIBG8_19650 [Nonomuraea sp. NPDC050556]|uniref:hypothetical protein n=1 Tax=Nonomuraea sp. NPDC050556 TaxID=3364369 RepID=UPI0037B2A0DC
MDVNDLAAQLRALSARQARASHSATEDPPALEMVEELDDYLLEEIEIADVVESKPKAVAAYRAKRTGYQGLIAAVLIAVGGVFTSLSIGADIDWRLLGLSVGQAVLTAVVSYLHNDKAA